MKDTREYESRAGRSAGDNRPARPRRLLSAARSRPSIGRAAGPPRYSTAYRRAISREAPSPESDRETGSRAGGPLASGENSAPSRGLLHLVFFLRLLSLPATLKVVPSRLPTQALRRLGAGGRSIYEMPGSHDYTRLFTAMSRVLPRVCAALWLSCSSISSRGMLCNENSVKTFASL